MRKIKSLVNNVRPFPAYYNAIDALSESLEAEKEYAKATQLTFGEEFVKFINSQPKEYQKQLKDIQTCGKKEAEAIKSLSEKLSTLPADLQGLSIIQQDIHRKGGMQPSVVESKNTVDPEVEELRKRFIDSLVSSLKAAAEARIETANKLNDIAQEMSAFVNDFHDFKDPLLPKLVQRADQLQYEIVD
ncbi:hypothetical protein TRFO_32474 [Tritrichomonas foetus]|uniref:Uncharacterized protein n=1 Tax=Tritrichomonas foetus TaxID=1144522 RepID=A0A1J4JNN3_9EUKA|nr:hypothetical protein TRFO_32474 [Tritrichomonas foetus]|eukprot:OHT00743.1 hypothetical protein TRFO_32474 [Tritrichomonas foetus]